MHPFQPKNEHKGECFVSMQDAVSFCESLPEDHKVMRVWVNFTHPPTDDEIAAQRQDHNERRSQLIASLQQSIDQFRAQQEQAKALLPGYERELERMKNMS